MSRSTRTGAADGRVQDLLAAARRHHQAGELAQAEALYRQALARSPQHAEALYWLGVLAFQAGRAPAAEELIRRAIAAQPEAAAPHFSLGVVLQSLKRSDDALVSYREAVRRKPDYVEALTNAGVIHQERGELDAAVDVLRRALRARPDYLLAQFNLGNALRAQGEMEAAEQCYRSCLRLKPDFAEAHNNLGATLWEQARDDEAMACYREALRLQPRNAQAHNNLGGMLYELGRGEEAVAAYRQAIAVEPRYADAHRNLGNAYYEQARFDEAMACYRAALALAPGDGLRIRLATAIPMLADSVAEIDAIRAGLDARVTALLAQELRVGDPVREIGHANFFLAYHGRDDRALQSKLARLYLHACPELAYTAPHCAGTRPAPDGRVRIGIISKYLKNHSIGKTSRGIVEHLSRDDFEVIVFFLGPPRDEIGRAIHAAADRAVVLPNDLKTARERIAAEELDILFYQDTGMDAFTFFLAFARLAPVQCTSFGHPVTTGIPNLDYYVSTESWEPPGADAHYSERLARLRGTPSVAYYYEPPFPETLKPRAGFGLSDAEHVYVCPQTLFKFHPEFDALLAGILRADPAGRLVLVEGKHPYWGERLRARFATTIPDVTDRIRFVPQQRGGDFINLIAVSDVMLDTIHFCGFNTTLEAFRAGTPVVTLPGAFMRSRHTLSFYEKMGMRDCVAGSPQEYVDIAVRLGCDRGFREGVRAALGERRAVLWRDATVIREFERFFRAAVAAAH